MNNLEIQELINEFKIKNFLGIFMRDEIPLSQLSKFYFIYNTQASNENGSHWNLFCRIDYKYYHASSFGDDPSKEITDKYKPIMSSTFRSQGYSEKSCGLYCILLIYLLEHGNSFEDSILELTKSADLRSD